jgi:hypothetical protein
MGTKFEFLCTCVDCGPSRLPLWNAMLDSETDISRETFMRHCGASARTVFRELGYAAHPSQGLTAVQDYHISYHRSKWGRRRCYYFKWSAIEHVFVEGSGE